MSAVDAVLHGLAAREASGTRILCIDGPAGAGKTTLATAVADRLDARVVHLDDLYEGWGGLTHVDTRLAELLRPLAQSRAGRFRRWDWLADSWAETVVVEPVPLVIVEGVGSGSWRTADLLVWVEAPTELRRRRGVDRDDGVFAPHWERWAADEATRFARDRTRERADLLVDGSDGSVLSSQSGSSSTAG